MKTIITGGAGTVGRAIAKELVSRRSGPVVGIDCDEERLFWAKKEVPGVDWFLRRAEDLRCKDIDAGDRVVHAAARKHVGLCEENPEECIRDNVSVTAELAGKCWNSRAHFCLISTDKAVQPRGIYGHSKMVAERIIDSWRHAGLKVTIIRFANVLGSSGSVLRVWESEKLVAVTSRKMKRWFISEDDMAVNVLQAIESTSDRDYLWVIKPEEETNIYEMAKEYAAEAGKDIIITHPGVTEKAAEVFVWPNQTLERRGGLLYVVRRCDVEDTLLQPGRDLRTAEVGDSFRLTTHEWC